MRIVGHSPRNEFVLDPEEAVRRGAQLDGMLILGNIPRPKGVRRMSHSQMNQEDFERSLCMARSLNKPD